MPTTLTSIKLVHTAVWVLLVACIIALPICGKLRRLRWAAGLGAVITLECVVLALNHFRCPLTDLASGYTTDRADNFDIYLPLWLARHNQLIFGTLFVAGGLYGFWAWLSARPGAPRTLAALAAILELILGIGALGGGLALILGPRGELLPLPVSLLEGSPFQSYLGPGVILFAVLGVGPLVVAVLVWRGNHWAPLLTLAAGAALLIWLAVEIGIVGYASDPPLQPLYLGLGAALSLVGAGWLRLGGTRYHGGFAPNAKLRRVVPPPPDAEARIVHCRPRGTQAKSPPAEGAAKSKTRRK